MMIYEDETWHAFTKAGGYTHRQCLIG